MYELIKAEMAYKKWEYAVYFLLPLLLTSMFFMVIHEGDTFAMDMGTSILFGYGSSLLLLSMALPQFIHKTSMEENRYSLLAQFPISLKSLALTQSFPLLFVISSTAFVGYGCLGILGLAYANVSHMMVLNCIFLALAISISNLFLRELLTQLPKYFHLICWFLALSFIFISVWLEKAFGIEWDIFDASLFEKGSTLLILLCLCFMSFVAHIVLFTHIRKDFSQARSH